VEEMAVTGDDQQRATAFVRGYGQMWESWDIAGFVGLFSDAVVYVAHPTETTILGSEALAPYVEGQKAEMGTITVRMGRPIVEANRVAAEFWVTATNQDGEETTAGCLLAQLDPADGRCTHFREYWFDLDGHIAPYDGWGFAGSAPA
jgi:ketosteroid isomerase-like protein